MSRLQRIMLSLLENAKHLESQGYRLDSILANLTTQGVSHGLKTREAIYMANAVVIVAPKSLDQIAEIEMVTHIFNSLIPKAA